MAFTVLEILLFSAVFMTVLFFAYFVMRGSLYSSFSAPVSRIVGGTLIAGIGCSLLLSVLLFMVLPTYYYISSATPEGYRMAFVLNSDFLSESGLRFIINETSCSYSLVAKVYGDEELDDDEEPVTAVPQGKTRVRYGIDGWFEPFPPSVSDDSNGEVLRYVIVDEWVESELEKSVSFEYETQ